MSKAVDKTFPTVQVFRTLVRQAGLPPCATEYQFAKPRKWRLDYAWPKHKLALEVEGGVWNQGRHNRGSGFVKDMEKYNELAVRGWRLIRVTPDTLCTTQTIEMVTQALTPMENA